MGARLGVLAFLAIAWAAIAGCTGSSPVLRGAQSELLTSGSQSPSPSPIQHIVLVIQENRTFNNFFATFPGADGTTTGTILKDASCHVRKTRTIPLTKSPLITPLDFQHDYQGYRAARDGGKMDAFDKVSFSNGLPECRYPYQYVDPSQIQPYWDIAQQYALAEHMFTTQGSSSFTAHQDLIAGGTVVEPDESLVNLPTCSGGTCKWGCDAPAGTHTSLISYNGAYEPGKGPFPCSNQFATPYSTLRDLLDAKGLSWKYYAPPFCCNTNGRLFTAFDVIYPVRYGPEWQANISSPQTNIFNDISNGTLPAMSWLIPDGADSDHPGEQIDNGPSWVASVVNAIGESSYWESTAIVVVWDDWGGLYDNLNPPQVGYGGLGFRVPALVVSPYAKPGYISQTQYEFGSILRYIEENWNLGSLGSSDKRATSIIDCFDYSQAPIPFQPIPSKMSKLYFLHRAPSYVPVDTDM
jgi:phospholipase C